MGYNFKNNLYPADINYHHFRYVNIFFTTTEQTKEFFKYLYYRIKNDYEIWKNGGDVCLHVLRNDADYAPLIDIEYNFLVLVIAEWIEHYSSNKTVMKEFTRYATYNKTLDDGSTEKHKKYRDYKIEFTIKELVQFDYAYTSWIIGAKAARRYDLIQILFNELLGKHTYVRNYSNRYKSIPVTLYLVKDNKFNKYLKFPAVSFVRKTLATYYTPKEVKLLRKIGDEYEKIISTSRAIKSRIEKLKLNEDEIKICNYFDIESIQKTRDLGDGEYHIFEKKEDENDDENASDDDEKSV